jgi:hypothetical protein
MDLVVGMRGMVGGTESLVAVHGGGVGVAIG